VKAIALQAPFGDVPEQTTIYKLCSQTSEFFPYCVWFIV